MLIKATADGLSLLSARSLTVLFSVPPRSTHSRSTGPGNSGLASRRSRLGRKEREQTHREKMEVISVMLKNE